MRIILNTHQRDTLHSSHLSPSCINIHKPNQPLECNIAHTHAHTFAFYWCLCVTMIDPSHPLMCRGYASHQRQKLRSAQRTLAGKKTRILLTITQLLLIRISFFPFRPCAHKQMTKLCLSHAAHTHAKRARWRCRVTGHLCVICSYCLVYCCNAISVLLFGRVSRMFDAHPMPYTLSYTINLIICGAHNARTHNGWITHIERVP